MLGLLAVPISRRVGLTGALVASFVLVVIALLLRPVAGVFSVFVALSVLALLGPALGNVLVPAWVKLHGGARTVGLMTLYSVMLAIGGSSPPPSRCPRRPGADGWQDSLRFWGIVAVVPVVVWAVVLTRTGHDFPPAPPRGSSAAPCCAHPTAIALMLTFSMQSLNAYTQFGMLPQILTEAGVSPARAGVLVAVIAGWGLVGGLVMPSVIAKVRVCAGSWRLRLLTTLGYVGLLLAPSVARCCGHACWGSPGSCSPPRSRCCPPGPGTR